MLLPALAFFLSFAILWMSTRLIISSVVILSRRLHISSFLFSFVALGILTSIPEISLGINSILEERPEMYVGNLIGGIVVIFTCIIPILAILGRGVRLTHEMSRKWLVLAIFTILLPTLLVMDGIASAAKGVVMILMYILLVYMMDHRDERPHPVANMLKEEPVHVPYNITMLLFGIGFVFLASRTIVDLTLFFAEIFSLTPYWMSLIILSFGTNLPEFSIAIRAAVSGQKDVALGDYIGSASVNTLLFGIFSIINWNNVAISNHYVLTLISMLAGLGLFFFFSTSKRDISRREGIVLLLVYLTFLILESTK